MKNIRGINELGGTTLFETAYRKDQQTGLWQSYLEESPFAVAVWNVVEPSGAAVQNKIDVWRPV